VIVGTRLNMIPRHLLFVVIVVFLASLFGTHIGASWANRWLFAASAFVFSATATIAAFLVNRRYWRGTAVAGGKPEIVQALIASTQLSALVYAWGATALLLVYSASGLYWQHGWQYGLAMALIAAGMAYYAKLLGQKHPDLLSENAIEWAAFLASAQGIAVSVVLLWLVASGKILTPRADWAANLIFVAGGMSIVCLCAFVTKSYHELTRNRDSSN
jgi:hypothetical protein